MFIEEMEGVRRWAGELGLELDREKQQLIRIHLATLWQWNERMNLTGLKSTEALVEDLLLDSMAASSFFPETGNYLDAGSGAGFPAIPIKIMKPELTTYLVESIRKRVSFLREVIRRLGLKGMVVVEGRVEAVPEPLIRGSYQRVTARAVARLPTMITWCAPMVAPGGLLVCFEGREGVEGLRKAEDVIEANHLQIETVFGYRLPKKQNLRHIVTLKRITSQ